MEIIYNSQEDGDKKRLYLVLKNLQSGVYKVTLQKIKDSRSLNQNKYYWAVVVSVLASEVGYFKDEMHMVLRRKFLGYTRTTWTQCHKLCTYALQYRRGSELALLEVPIAAS